MPYDVIDIELYFSTEDDNSITIQLYKPQTYIETRYMKHLLKLKKTESIVSKLTENSFIIYQKNVFISYLLVDNYRGPEDYDYL